MRASESDRARWADTLAQVEEEIDALTEAMKESVKEQRGTIATLRKRARLLLRYISGREQEPLELPLELKTEEAGPVGRDAAREVEERHNADPKDCRNPECAHSKRGAP